MSKSEFSSLLRKLPNLQMGFPTLEVDLKGDHEIHESTRKTRNQLMKFDHLSCSFALFRDFRGRFSVFKKNIREN